MPIKLPKGFNRRRSSGNALDEVPNPPATAQPSFRVFERRPSGSKSFDGGNNLQQPRTGVRPLSAGHYLENVSPEDGQRPSQFTNRNSAATNHSSSTGGLYTSSSSARFSSSSTLPSFSSVEGSDEYSHAHPKPSNPSSPGGFLRAAGRTFSFGKKLTQPDHQDEEPLNSSPKNRPTSSIPDLSHPLTKAWTAEERTSGTYSRPRAMTDQSYTSESTTKPPRLPDASLSLDVADDDDFGNMFEGIGAKRGETVLGREMMTSPPAEDEDRPPQVPPKNAYLTSRPTFTPPPHLSMNRSRDLIDSPYSVDSHDSRDGLLANKSPKSAQRRSQYGEEAQNGRSDARRESNNDRSSPALNRRSQQARKRASTMGRDTDADLVLESINASRRLDRNSGIIDEPSRPLIARKSVGTTANTSASHVQPPSRRSEYLDDPRTQGFHPSPISISSDSAPQSRESTPMMKGSSESTPRAQNVDITHADEPLLFDPEFQSMALSAQEYESRPVTQSPQVPKHGGKVMTPAQFEKYRKEQELSRLHEDSGKDEDSDNGSDKYDDDDEVERSRLAVKQRRKQEAHLSVYRQQMMKVTGEQPSMRPHLGASASTPNLSNRGSGLEGRISDDEDDEVPLGILAAHGFPSKDRAPAHGTTRTIKYQSETYPPPTGSVAGSVAGGRSGGNLPPFARGLPKDPYFGAGLVNPSPREGMGMSNSGAASVYGGSQAGTPHPGGLVGVIASEERARAARRGSPNTQGGFGTLAPNGTPMVPGMMPGMPGMPMSPGEQAQIQMSQQMNQMMQMQMQWMQQMMAMQQQQGMVPNGKQMSPPMLGMPGMSPQIPQQQQQQMHPSMLPPQPGNGFLSPDMMSQRRPMSMGLPFQQGNLQAQQQQQQQRAMSMLAPPPSSSAWGNASGSRMSAATSTTGGLLAPSMMHGYSPSIAPSERSNIGQPSRYRPVSIAPSTIDENGNGSQRTMSMSSGHLLGGGPGMNNKMGGVQTTVKMIGGGGGVNGGNGRKGGKGGSDGDTDEDEGWKEMRMRREKKKIGWKSRKGGVDGGAQRGLGDVFYPGT
ncbi:hypothetical protein MMC25_004595 [Agyrium rufum]|nr:hypothetical protein [Agyrium rufum]